jgi:hypothetical protein
MDRQGKSRKHRQGKVSRKQRRKIIARSANRHSGLYAGPAGKVRGGLDQEPVLAVGADGKTRLGARPHARIARPCQTACRAATIALRELKTASAVGSSLLRLMKPEPDRLPLPPFTVIGPGFSNRNSARASTPPPTGSKSGTSNPGRRSFSAKVFNWIMCGRLSMALRCSHTAGSRIERS